MPPSLSHPKYRPDIDGLRAIAVSSVVIYHAFPNLLKGGFIGVDIFFVISGFLISTIIFGNLNSNSFSFKSFYLRRINRIYPALIIVLVSCYIAGWYALLPNEFEQLGKHISGGAGFVSNIVLWSESGYFDNAAELKPLLHLWSLGVEEQFYIVWPLLLWILWRFKANLIVITLIITISSFLLNIYSTHYDQTSAFYSPLARFWELLLGGILAWISSHKSDYKNFRESNAIGLIPDNIKPIYRSYISNISSVFGLLLLISGLITIDQSDKFPGYFALIPSLGAVMIIAAGSNAFVNKCILSNRFLVFIGLISYPLYLWHWPLLSFARILEDGLPSSEIRASAVLIAIILAWSTYKFVEIPLRNFKSINRGIFLFLSMLILGCVGFYTFYKDGLPKRDSLRSIRVTAELFSTPLHKVDSQLCNVIYKDFSKNDADLRQRCSISKPVAPTVAIIGDSHTEHYRSVLFQRLSNQSVLAIFKPACLPFAGKDMFNDVCESKYQQVYTMLKDDRSIKTVILSGYWAYLMSGGFAKEDKADNWRQPKPVTKVNSDVFAANAEKMLDMLVSSGRKVIFMKDIPSLDFNIRKCFDYRPLRLTENKVIQNCSVNENEYLTSVKQYDAVIDKILKRYPSITVFDPKKILCKEGRCQGSDGSVPYYFNGDHLNDYGAGLIIDDMIHNGLLVN